MRGRIRRGQPDAGILQPPLCGCSQDVQYKYKPVICTLHDILVGVSGAGSPDLQPGGDQGDSGDHLLQSAAGAD